MAAGSKLAKSCLVVFAVIGLSGVMSACAGHSVDWAGLGAGAAHQACKNSSHCDVPCSRDGTRPDCVTGSAR